MWNLDQTLAVLILPPAPKPQVFYAFQLYLAVLLKRVRRHACLRFLFVVVDNDVDRPLFTEFGVSANLAEAAH